jgi:TATA-box binding protein (TBP) (component of TFIID and TFIIIB)
MESNNQPYATSTRTFVVYCSCISPVDLDVAHKKVQDFKIPDGEILSIKYGPNDKTSNCLKCLTLSLKFGKPTEETSNSQVQKQSKRGRKITRKKISGKLLSVKLFRNGSTQVTGCKTIDHVQFSMNVVFMLLELDRVQEMNVVSIMNNVNFSMGFQIDREKLGKYFSEQGINVPPITTGYMGIKIRLQSLVDKHSLLIQRFSWTKQSGFENMTPIPYLEFFAHDVKKVEKNFTTCIGIFQNGKILMTCIDDFTTKVMHQHVFEMLKTARPRIELQERIIKTFKR